MATRTTVVLEDDLDGGPAQETVRFGLGAAEYEIDLNASNANRFRSQLAPFIGHARKAGRGQRTSSARPAAARHHSAHVRAWAKQHGIEISERGRIPAAVIEQYEAAPQQAD
jgi:Lsr2